MVLHQNEKCEEVTKLFDCTCAFKSDWILQEEVVGSVLEELVVEVFKSLWVLGGKVGISVHLQHELFLLLVFNLLRNERHIFIFHPV